MRCQTFLLTLLAAFVFSVVSVPARLMAEKLDYPNVLYDRRTDPDENNNVLREEKNMRRLWKDSTNS